MTRDQAIDEASSLYDWLRRSAECIREGDELEFEPDAETLELWAEALADLAYPRAH